MSETETPKTPEELVAAFAESETRYPAYAALQAFGRKALPAICTGLRHGNWQVRKWSAMFLDHHADPDSLVHLVPLLGDQMSDVRLWAVHSISCDGCKEGECPIDVVPYLIERIEHDESIRVRRMAVAMLGIRGPEPRAIAIFKWVLEHETDRKLRFHAETGLGRASVEDSQSAKPGPTADGSVSGA